jgi:hypothetical protein
MAFDYTSVTGSLSDLATLPSAKDGEVITSEHFNKMLRAIRAIAQQLGVGFVSQTVTLTFPPAFLLYEDGPNWYQVNGIARKQEAYANGWLPIQLPIGARIQSMTVLGRRKGDVPEPGLYTISLMRQEIVNPTQAISLILLDWQKDNGLNKVSGPLQVPGVGPEVNEVLKVVDNSTYKYYLVASLIGATGTELITEIHAIQIECRIS